VIRGPLDRLATTASLVFIADFATKQWALRALADGDRWLGAGWHLSLVNNTHLAGGLDGRGLEVPVTAILTTVAALLMLRICGALTSIDSGAPVTLGLLIGAGAANLADALMPPRGVVDFIAFTGSAGRTVSFNVADVLLVVGLSLCIRTVWRLAIAIRGGDELHHSPNSRQYPGVLPMRERLLASGGHALLAMCGFVWLYSMAVAFTPDAGRSAPNSLLCGVAVFAVVFVASQLRLYAADRRFAESLRTVRQSAIAERVVLDGSVASAMMDDGPAERLRPLPLGDRPRSDEPRDDGLA
jgi:lipoprotein signal peptidase